ncbi:hypothetical protein ACRQ5B_14140 [Pseudarthrobacter sp. L19]|uniref:hypothetical protein n=1 Tax=Pseudarthrobacter sp. L19 TaxID=3423951 RepID=UPI003D7B8D19
MGSAPTRRRPPPKRRTAQNPPRRARAALTLVPLLVSVAVACTGPTGPAATGTAPAVAPTPGSSGPVTASVPTGTQSPVPVTAAMNQFRDNYSKQIVEIQLTNTTSATLTVEAADVTTALFAAAIGWTTPGGGTELPPGQAKSLPAPLPAAACPAAGEASGTSGTDATGLVSGSGAKAGDATLRLRDASGAVSQVTVAVTDPFGALTRNNDERCVAQAANAVAGFRFAPDLRRTADGRAAVVDLVITPRHAGDTTAKQTLSLDGVGGTTLLAEDAAAPWPHGLEIAADQPERVVPLGLRPARCDPHAVAEDKVGTLIPLHVTVGGRPGTLKVDVGPELRGRIYDFVTAACGRQ